MPNVVEISAKKIKIKMPLGTKLDLGSRYICYVETQSPHRNGAQLPIVIGPCLWPNGCPSHQLLLSTNGRPKTFRETVYLETRHVSRASTNVPKVVYLILCMVHKQSTVIRPVASRNQSQTHSDATGLNCGDRSCNAPLIKVGIARYLISRLIYA